MSRRPDTIVIPEEIREYLLSRFKQTAWQNGGGDKGLYDSYTTALNNYLFDNRDTNAKIRKWAEKFKNGSPSAETVYRAFGYKHGRGREEKNRASRKTCNVLALFQSEGKLDWNETIRDLFPLPHANLMFDVAGVNLTTNLSQTRQQDFESLAWEIGDFMEVLRGGEGQALRIQLAGLLKEQQNKRERIGKILVPSGNDPDAPEYPPDPFTPQFPATGHEEIVVGKFRHIIVKNESENPGGTHKSRMAWEIVVNAWRTKVETGSFPTFSLISSGTAAIAIQYFLNFCEVESKLKVLVDRNLNPEMKRAIRAIGCELFEEDLAAKLLEGDDVLRITRNPNGVDITCRPKADILGTKYYDWLSFEILNLEPDYCFIPFGTGDLFVNVLKTVKTELLRHYDRRDKRLRADILKIAECHFMAATTNDPQSKLEKLYAPHLRYFDKHKRIVAGFKEDGYVGHLSGIEYVNEKYVEPAMKIAKDNNISCEYSAIAGLALFLQMRNHVNPNKRIVIVNTGLTDLHPKDPRPQKSQ